MKFHPFLSGPAVRDITRAQRGYAMVFSMLSLVLLTGLGLSAAFMASGDMAISGNFRRNEQAFYAAEAGLGVAREVIREQLKTVIETNANAAAPTVNAVYQPASTNPAPFDATSITSILTSTALTSTATNSPRALAAAAINARGSGIGSYSSFSVTPANLTLTLLGTTEGPRPSAAANNNIAQPPAYIEARYGYTINITGTYNAPSDPNSTSLMASTASTGETGVVTIRLNTNSTPNASAQPVFKRSFSSFGTFWHRTTLSSSSQLAGGVYGGPTHTNQALAFNSSSTYVFKGALSQAGSSTAGGSTYGYKNGSNFSHYNVNTTARSGLSFESTYTKTATLPLPDNVYSQQLAVLNGTGETDATFTTAQPTAAQLAANLRTATNTAPTVTGGALATGVYISSSNGTSISGGGIYVKGTAKDVQLSVSGTSQVYKIT
ncbi:MAG: PilX N-terminal domain-containing pilus assembly protein, partial [Blastocatellia bacterium]